MFEADPTSAEQIERLEAQIDELREAIRRSRRMVVVGRACALVGAALLICLALGLATVTADCARRPSSCLGRLDRTPPTYGTVGPFLTVGRLASPGRLAGGAEGIRTKSCPIAKRTRSFTIFQWPYRMNQTSIVGDLRCATVKDAPQSSLDRSARPRQCLTTRTNYMSKFHDLTQR